MHDNPTSLGEEEGINSSGIKDLGFDVLESILSKMQLTDRVALTGACKKWHQFGISCPSLWDDISFSTTDQTKLASFAAWLSTRKAVNRLSINIEGMPAPLARIIYTGIIIPALPPMLVHFQIRLHSTLELGPPLPTLSHLQTLSCAADVIHIPNTLGSLPSLTSLSLGSFNNNNAAAAAGVYVDDNNNNNSNQYNNMNHHHNVVVPHQLLCGLRCFPKSLTKLSIGNCHPLFRLPNCLEACTDLQSITLSRVTPNRGYALSDWVSPVWLLPHLTSLDLSAGEWHAVPQQLSRLTMLRTLVISDSMLCPEEFSGAIPPLPVSMHPMMQLGMLRVLDMRGCGLGVIDDIGGMMQCMTALKTLYLGRNPHLIIPRFSLEQVQGRREGGGGGGGGGGGEDDTQASSSSSSLMWCPALENLEIDAKAAIASPGFSMLSHLKRVAFTPSTPADNHNNVNCDNNNNGGQHLCSMLMLLDNLEDVLFCTHTLDRLNLGEGGVAGLITLSQYKTGLRIRFGQGNVALSKADF